MPRGSVTVVSRTSASARPWASTGRPEGTCTDTVHSAGAAPACCSGETPIAGFEGSADAAGEAERFAERTRPHVRRGLTYPGAAHDSASTLEATGSPAGFAAHAGRQRQQRRLGQAGRWSGTGSRLPLFRSARPPWMHSQPREALWSGSPGTPQRVPGCEEARRARSRCGPSRAPRSRCAATRRCRSRPARARAPRSRTAPARLPRHEVEHRHGEGVDLTVSGSSIVTIATPDRGVGRALVDFGDGRVREEVDHRALFGGCRVADQPGGSRKDRFLGRRRRLAGFGRPGLVEHERASSARTGARRRVVSGAPASLNGASW